MKRVLITLTTISTLAIPLGAQETVDLAMIERIKAEGLERSKVMEHFNYLTNVVGPRLSATPAYKRAADWGVLRFEEWGLGGCSFRVMGLWSWLDTRRDSRLK